MKLFKKIFSPLSLIISVLLLIYTFYKSQIYWGGSKIDYYLIYFFVSSLLIIFSITTFFIREEIKEYFIIISFSIVFALYSFEAYLTFKDQIYKARIYKKETGKKYDLRNRLEIYNDQKKLEKNTSVTVFPSSYLNSYNSFFPLSSKSNSETIHCNENGYYSIYQSDRFGFNNPDKEWSSDEVEYFIIGDSFTHGACVNRPDDIASVLRSLSNKSVLNLGYGDTGPLIQYATLREYLNSNVKKVLWIYYEGNDLQNLRKEINNPILKNYIKDLNFTQKLKLKQSKIDELADNEIERAKKNKSFYFKFINFIKIYKIRTNFMSKRQPVLPPQPEFKKILTLVKQLTIEKNANLYFIYLPVFTRYDTAYDNTNYDLIKKIIIGLDIPFIDIHKEVFKIENNPKKLFSFEMYYHYTVDGYNKVANTIFRLTKD